MLKLLRFNHLQKIKRIQIARETVVMSLFLNSDENNINNKIALSLIA